MQLVMTPEEKQEFNNKLISFIREKFQTKESRGEFLALMVKEIRLDMMKQQQQRVSMLYAYEELTKELTDVLPTLIKEDILTK
jgi:hypothetical protein